MEVQVIRRHNVKEAIPQALEGMEIVSLIYFS